MNSFDQLISRTQEPIAQLPYDRWLTPEGTVSAEFFRTLDGFIVRFPSQADFEIDAAGQRVRCVPVQGMQEQAINDIYLNSVRPILGNHNGELNVHGSAVAVAGRALAFLGHSGRGKTTLAGACACGGYPFLTEDVISLKRAGKRYFVEPKRPVLRLFSDSAAFLLGGEERESAALKKSTIEASPVMPHCCGEVPLARIYILGPGEANSIMIERLSQAESLTHIMQHAFILDVEDRLRLRSHFERIAELVELVPCYFLDYPRNYLDLPKVVERVVGQQ